MLFEPLTILLAEGESRGFFGTIWANKHYLLLLLLLVMIVIIIRNRKFRIMLATSFPIIGELFGFLWKQKLWWILPMIMVLLSLGLFLFIANSSGVGAFIYTLF